MKITAKLLKTEAETVMAAENAACGYENIICDENSNINLQKYNTLEMAAKRLKTLCGV